MSSASFFVVSEDRRQHGRHEGGTTTTATRDASITPQASISPAPGMLPFSQAPGPGNCPRLGSRTASDRVSRGREAARPKSPPGPLGRSIAAAGCRSGGRHHLVCCCNVGHARHPAAAAVQAWLTPSSNTSPTDEPCRPDRDVEASPQGTRSCAPPPSTSSRSCSSSTGAAATGTALLPAEAATAP